MPDLPGNAPPPGSLAGEALRRGKQMRRRRLLVTRGATSAALAGLVAIGLVIRFGGSSQPSPTPADSPATTAVTPTTFGPSPTTNPPTTTTPPHPGTTQPHSSFSTSTSVPAAPQTCAASQLGGSFQYVGAAAGSRYGNFELRNTSAATCTLSGRPELQLLAKSGSTLATNVQPAGANETATVVTLAPGASAYSSYRYSPDVSGVGEPNTGQCEPTAYGVQVTIPGSSGSLTLAFGPTPVCEHGTIYLSELSATRPLT